MMDLKEFVKLSRKIGFPRTADTHDYTKPTKYRTKDDCRQYMHWSKSGGHAGGKMISRVLEKAKKAGFKPQQFQNSCSPDGNYVNSGQKFVKVLRGKVVATLSYYDHYGVTKYENHFSLTLEGPKDEPAEKVQQTSSKK